MTDNVHTAMLSIQTQLENPLKTTTGAHSAKYAELPDIIDQVKPILAAAGLYVTQLVQFMDTNPYLESIIYHAASGTFIASKMPLMLDKQTPQGMGSSITYARRYALCAMLNIAGDKDDDGDSASIKKGQEREKPPKVEPEKPVPIVPARIEFIIKTINDANDEAMVRTLNATAKQECQDAKDDAAYAKILAAAKAKLQQLKGE